jgi:hypothetical protein
LTSEATNYGSTVTSLEVFIREGKNINVTLGFGSLEGHCSDTHALARLLAITAIVLPSASSPSIGPSTLLQETMGRTTSMEEG